MSSLIANVGSDIAEASLNLHVLYNSVSVSRLLKET